jgi:hypothetical protein
VIRGSFIFVQQTWDRQLPKNSNLYKKLAMYPPATNLQQSIIYQEKRTSPNPQPLQKGPSFRYTRASKIV